MSKVDVVIPCYNYARFLRQSVESVLKQTGVDVRVLIIDDCSSDETESVGLLLADQDSRVTFLRHSENRGHIATYNEGLIEWASADYSMLLSADDAVAPGALSRACQLMDRYPDVGMSCGMGRVIWDEENYASIPVTSSTEFQIISGADFLKRCFLKGNPVCTPSAVVRTALQHRLGGYRAELPHSGDMEMWMRFAQHGPVIIHQSVQAYYRKHRANMSIHYFGQLLEDMHEVLDACEQIFAQLGDEFPESSEWRESMLHRMANECCWLASMAFDRGDIKGYRTCIEFAEQICPKIRNSLRWRKVRSKSFVGQLLWQLIMPTWERLRELRKSFSGQAPQITTQKKDLTGWWPGLHES